MVVKQKWVCPKCGYKYESPTKLVEMGHPCSKAQAGLGPKKFVKMKLAK